MSKIILPGDTREAFGYAKLIGGDTKIPTAMVKFPVAMLPEEGSFLLIKNPADDAHEDFEVTRYEFHTYTGEPVESAEELVKQPTDKDGYVYLPKLLRDGRHESCYLLLPIKEAEFTPKVERGMFEEVAWSPFGTVSEAFKQEAQNTDRNPLLRRWEYV